MRCTKQITSDVFRAAGCGFTEWDVDLSYSSESGEKTQPKAGNKDPMTLETMRLAAQCNAMQLFPK